MKILYNPAVIDEKKNLGMVEKTAEDGTPLFGSLIKDFDLEIRPDYAYFVDGIKTKLVKEKYPFVKVYDNEGDFRDEFGKKKIYNLGEQELEDAEKAKAEKIANLKAELAGLEDEPIKDKKSKK